MSLFVGDVNEDDVVFVVNVGDMDIDDFGCCEFCIVGEFEEGLSVLLFFYGGE